MSDSGNAGALALVVIFIIGMMSEAVPVESGATPEQLQMAEDYRRSVEANRAKVEQEMADFNKLYDETVRKAARDDEEARRIRRIADVMSGRVDPDGKPEKRDCDLLRSDAFNQRVMEDLNKLPQFSVMTPYARERVAWKIKNRLAQLTGGCYW